MLYVIVCLLPQCPIWVWYSLCSIFLYLFVILFSVVYDSSVICYLLSSSFIVVHWFLPRVEWWYSFFYKIVNRSVAVRSKDFDLARGVICVMTCSAALTELRDRHLGYTDRRGSQTSGHKIALRIEATLNWPFHLCNSFTLIQLTANL